MSKTTLQNFGVPLDGGKGRGGILQPILAWRFRAVPQRVSEDVVHNFAQQVENVSIDFVARRVRINIRATVLQETFDAALLVANTGDAPRVDVMDGGDGVLFSIRFGGTKLVKHNVDFAYSNSGHVVHEMEWSFDVISLSSPLK